MGQTGGASGKGKKVAEKRSKAAAAAAAAAKEVKKAEEKEEVEEAEEEVEEEDGEEGEEAEEVEEEEQEQDQEEQEQEEEQDGLSVHSPCKPSSSSLLRKESSQVELELRLLEGLEMYPVTKLQGIHRHFVLYGLTEFLRRRFNRHFASEDVLKLLDRFYNLEMLKPDEEDAEILNHEEEFSLPQSYFITEES